MKLLVTGATGDLGARVVAALLRTIPARDLAVSVRQPGKAEKWRDHGIDVRHGDFDDPESLDTAFSGMDRMLIISTNGDNATRIRQHRHAVDAAARAGVRFIAYTSIVNARESKNPLAQVHRATEAAIRETGIPYAFLRNNWYLENETATIQSVLAGAPWLTAAGNGKVGWALKQDYAEAAAAVLSGKGREKAVYELSGPLLTQAELASALGDVLGRTVPVRRVDDAAYAAQMKEAGLPDGVVAFLTEIQKSIRENTLAIASDDFEKLLGRPPVPAKEALTQLVAGLSQQKQP